MDNRLLTLNGLAALLINLMFQSRVSRIVWLLLYYLRICSLTAVLGIALYLYKTVKERLKEKWRRGNEPP
jgi:hypothetical protein